MLLVWDCLVSEDQTFAPLIFNQSKSDNQTVFFFGAFLVFAFSLPVEKRDLLSDGSKNVESASGNDTSEAS